MAKYFDQEFVINEDIVFKVVRVGFPLEYVVKSLEDNEANHCTTTYYLLADNGPQID